MIKPKQMFKYEINNLKKIGSSKDPLWFKTSSRFRFGLITVNRNIIINFSDNGKHGCRFGCSFCNWKDREEMKSDLFPNKEALDIFLDSYKGYRVIISGGGDPLFNYEKNNPRLISLINYIHSRGFLVDMITKEFDVVRNNPELDYLINYWSFSTEVRDENLIKTLDSIEAARISKLFDENKSVKSYIDYIEFYKRHVTQIIFRQDYNNPNLENNVSTPMLIKQLQMKYGSDFIRYVPAITCSSGLFLMNDKVTTGINEVPVELNILKNI